MEKPKAPALSALLANHSNSSPALRTASSMEEGNNKLRPSSASSSHIQRQASLPGRQGNSNATGAQGSPVHKLRMLKPLVRMNSDSDLHIQPISQEEASVLETLDEIDLLHNIAKTPNLLSGDKSKANLLKVPVSGSDSIATGKVTAPPGGDKRKLVKQKSLNRTLSTSVLRIKKKRCTFWNT